MRQSLLSLIRLNVQVNYTYKFNKSLVNQRDWKLPIKFVDDLFLPPERLQDGILQEMVDELLLKRDKEVHFKGIGMMLYNMAKTDFREPMIMRRFESNLFKYKDQFTHRLAFGAYFGLLRIDHPNFYMLEFLEKELRRTKSKLTLEETTELCEAFAQNKSQEQAYKHGILEEFIKPRILHLHKKRIRHHPQYQAKYFDEEVFDPLVMGLVNQKKIKLLETWIEVRNTIRQLPNIGYPREVEKYLKHLEDRLKTKDGRYEWFYNFEQDRFLTMEEMVAKRDINRFPDQKQSPLYYTKEEMDAFNNSDKVFVQEKTLEQKEKELEDVLKELMDEKYIQIKTGELEVDDDAEVTVDDLAKMFSVDEDQLKEVESQSSSDEENQLQLQKGDPTSPQQKKKDLKRRKGRKEREMDGGYEEEQE